MRNPWGAESFKGDWSPHSSKWVEHQDLDLDLDHDLDLDPLPLALVLTFGHVLAAMQDVKRLLKPEREDDGTFWLTWEDALPLLYLFLVLLLIDHDPVCLGVVP